MPYIEAKFSKKLTDVEITELKSGFGKAIEYFSRAATPRTAHMFRYPPSEKRRLPHLKK